MSYWYSEAVAVIHCVMADNPNATKEELRKLVCKAYPFGQRAMYPYKAWLKAVKDCLGPSKKAQTNSIKETEETGQQTLGGLS